MKAEIKCAGPFVPFVQTKKLFMSFTFKYISIVPIVKWVK